MPGIGIRKVGPQPDIELLGKVPLVVQPQPALFQPGVGDDALHVGIVRCDPVVVLLAAAGKSQLMVLGNGRAVQQVLPVGIDFS